MFHFEGILKERNEHVTYTQYIIKSKAKKKKKKHIVTLSVISHGLSIQLKEKNTDE